MLLCLRHAGSNKEQALSLHLSDTRSKQQRADEMLYGNRLRGETEERS